MLYGYLRHFSWTLCCVGLLACAGDDTAPRLVDAAGESAESSAVPPQLTRVDLSAGPYDVTSTLLAYPIIDRGSRDSSFSVHYQWFVNDTPVAGASGQSFSTENLGKGDTVFSRVALLVNGEEVAALDTESVVIGNALPRVTSASIGEGPYYTDSTIHASADVLDPDGDETRVEFDWFVNGHRVQSGASPVLTGNHFVRGDDVWVQAVPYDLSDGDKDGARGVPGESPRVTIQNSPPSQPGIVIHPAEPVSEAPIYAEVVTDSVDADGDAIDYEYAWYRDGELQDYPSDTTSITGEDISGGEEWTVGVTPTDGLSMGISAAAPSIRVLFSQGERVSGAYHTCVRTRRGGVKCWGRNDFGQLGDGTRTHRRQPIDVVGLNKNNNDQIAAGYYHTCVLRVGNVYCWGRGDYGQLGNNSFDNSDAPVAVVTDTSGTMLNNVQEITAGAYHTCARYTDDGNSLISCWGRGDFGQRGHGVNTERWARASATVSFITDAAGVSAGENHTCAVRQNGIVRCWGRNHRGQVGNGSTTDRNTPINVRDTNNNSLTIAANSSYLTAGGLHSCAQTSSIGELYCWGQGFGQNADVVVDSGVRAVSAGHSHTCARLAFDGLHCFGYNDRGQLGDGFQGRHSFTPVPVSGIDSRVYAISTGVHHTCVLSEGASTFGGHVHCWGDNSFGQLGNGVMGASQPAPVSLEGWAVGVDTGYDHSCALTPDGRVYCWGRNNYGQLGDGSTTSSDVPVEVPGLTNIVSIATGLWHTCVLQGNGRVRCWGRNTSGQVGNGSVSTSEATPQLVPSPATNIVSLSGGAFHTCAVNAGGTVYCWGQNTYGQLGDGTTEDNTSPVSIGTGYVMVAAGYWHTCATRFSGWLHCWGRNNYGQLGDGTTDDVHMPSRGTTFTDAESITARRHHTCLTTEGGSFHCWGYNWAGQIGDGTTDHRLTPHQKYTGGVAYATTGSNHTCLVSYAGHVRCWGRNLYGQQGIDTDGENVLNFEVPEGFQTRAGLAIAAGLDHTCMVTNGGEIRCAGRNNYGQLGIGGNGDQTYFSKVVAPPDTVSETKTYTEVAMGANHACAVRGDGVAVCWGAGDQGQRGDGMVSQAIRGVPAPVRGLETETVVSVTAGFHHSCALHENGGVWCWGANSRGQVGNGSSSSIISTPRQVRGLAGGVAAITSGDYHSCALLDSGAVRCWGANATAQLGTGQVSSKEGEPVDVVGLGSAMSIAAGAGHTCAVLTSGAPRCWGSSSHHQIGSYRSGSAYSFNEQTGVISGLTFEAPHSLSWVRPGDLFRNNSNDTDALITAVDMDAGTITVRMPPDPSRFNGGWFHIRGVVLAPVEPRYLTSGVSKITSGASHTCAIQNGNAYCWGSHAFGQIGRFTNDERKWPTQIFPPADTAVFDIEAGGNHTCWLLSSLDWEGGSLWCWGNDRYGQVGAGATGGGTYRTPEMSMVQRTGVASLGLGASNTCSIDSQGVMSCWGDNAQGLLGIMKPVPVVGF